MLQKLLLQKKEFLKKKSKPTEEKSTFFLPKGNWGKDFKKLFVQFLKHIWLLSFWNFHIVLILICSWWLQHHISFVFFYIKTLKYMKNRHLLFSKQKWFYNKTYSYKLHDILWFKTLKHLKNRHPLFWKQEWFYKKNLTRSFKTFYDIPKIYIAEVN